MTREGSHKLITKFVGTRGVQEYRESIDEWIDASDDVLELGCEWGTTTTVIAERARSVIGTDISAKCINRAREIYPEIRFEVLDAYDVLGATPRSELQQDLHGPVRLLWLPVASRRHRAPQHLRQCSRT